MELYWTFSNAATLGQQSEQGSDRAVLVTQLDGFPRIQHDPHTASIGSQPSGFNTGTMLPPRSRYRRTVYCRRKSTRRPLSRV